MPITVSPRPGGECTVVELSGEFDLDTADTLRDELIAAVHQHGGHLVLDLSAVDFIDSTTLSAFLQTEERTKQAGCTLRLAGLQRGPAKVLRVSGLDQHFAVFTSVDEALGAPVPPVAG